MTITPRDVRTLSSSPGPGGVPLPASQVGRIAAVLNRSTTPGRGASLLEETSSGPSVGH
jgi:hypothetical protein